MVGIMNWSHSHPIARSSTSAIIMATLARLTVTSAGVRTYRCGTGSRERSNTIGNIKRTIGVPRHDLDERFRLGTGGIATPRVGFVRSRFPFGPVHSWK